jgi:hypothetical protein
MQVFYLYANEVGKNITTCKKPSFLPHFTHIKPYYTRSEVINLALNMNIKLEDKYYNQEDVNKLCDKISNNDISADILLKHQKYIINNNKVGLVQYYTLQGSYFMNNYLRKLVNYNYKNIYLESLITPMWKLLNDSPAFDKTYTLYRFIINDNHLRHLNIGDIYTELGFTSTTRDPFYRSDLYKFGFILIKINIPKNIKGVALCVETLSHFPEEQEIILSPLSLFKLEKRDKNTKYYHTDEKFKSEVKTRYEFTYVGKRDISYINRPLYTDNKIIDFINLSKNKDISTITLEEKIRYFNNKYVNPMNQFIVSIDDTKFTIIMEKYDSTGAYNKFYAIKNQNGLLLYTIYNNYVLFMIELGNIDNKRYMHVNYYVKYSTLDREKIISDESFIKFISTIAYYFEINKIILWAGYKSCDKEYNLSGGNQYIIQRGFSKNDNLNKKIIKEQKIEEIRDNYLGGFYCIDFYLYLKNNIKKYNKINILNIDLHTKYSYYQLDKLKIKSPKDILKKDDLDELYQIYDKSYLPNLKKNKDIDNVANFYIWIINNKCYLTETLVNKMGRIYNIDNPFLNDYYILDPISFLYNKKIIETYPDYIVNDSSTIYEKKDIIPKNNYRIEYNREY